MNRFQRLMDRLPVWVIFTIGLVSSALAAGLLLFLLSWSIYAVWPGVDRDAMYVGNFLTGMALGSAGMMWWVDQLFKREERAIRGRMWP